MKQFYYINHYIRANEMRVVSETGEQLGVMGKGDALKKAQEAGMDLVLVAPNINPPVAKIIDFAKFKFQQEKKEQESKKKSKAQEIKEVRLRPFMAENDLMVRVRRAKKFLKDNDKVRFNVWFRGRQMSKKQFGYDLLKKIMNELAEIAIVEQEAKFRGNVLQMTVKPSKRDPNIQIHPVRDVSPNGTLRPNDPNNKDS